LVIAVTLDFGLRQNDGSGARLPQCHRSSWVEQAPPIYTLGSGIVVLEVGDWLARLGNAIWCLPFTLAHRRLNSARWQRLRSSHCMISNTGRVGGGLLVANRASQSGG